ncbi:heterokaryon incompatibility protein het-E-1, partial [Fusarium tjaetaba]
MADPSTYAVGWICALTTELVAAKSFFDEEYEVTLEAQAPGDNNCYSFGRMGRHDVVVASLPAEYGIAPAASVARDMLRTFPNIRVGLMVGIGGGAPSPRHDIRLGDIVVSVPSGDKGGVLHHNRGKTVQQQGFQLTGSLNQPPQLLLSAVKELRANYGIHGHELNERIEEVLNKYPRLKKRYARPSAAKDRLYESSHTHRESPKSAECKDNCGEENLIAREARGEEDQDPMIHYGLIASSDNLIKDATIRDKLAREEGVLCFEMEAAGLMNHFPCLIIRGICDYSDTHKNDEWQEFAAMTAAAYAKELLQKIPPTKIQKEKSLAKVLGEIGIELENITTNVEDTNATVNTMHASNRRLEIERWLKPPRSSTNVAKAKKHRHDGTGQWFIQGQAFMKFKAGLRKHLWLHGLAGCGKTVLSSQILDDLSAIEGSITLVHYFDFNDVEKQSVNGLLRSLVFQLFQHGGEATSEKLHELYKSCGRGLRDPDE